MFELKQLSKNFKIVSGNSRLFNTRDESVIFVKKKSEISRL